jgi:hypothetical protein
MDMKYVTLSCVRGYLLNSINDKKAEEPVFRSGYEHFSYKTLQYHTGIQKMLFNHAIKQMNEKQYVHHTQIFNTS